MKEKESGAIPEAFPSVINGVNNDEHIRRKGEYKLQAHNAGNNSRTIDAFR